MKYYFTFFLFLSAFTGFSQNPTCQTLHEGSFKITHIQSGTTLITRTKNIQKEENPDMGMVMLFDVKWIDDCTYELWPKKVLKGDKSMMGKKGDFMTVKIREIKEHSFMTETTSNFFDQTLFFEVDILR